VRRLAMRERAGVFCWAVGGSLAGFGLIGILSIGFPFLLAGLAMLVFAILKAGARGAWAGVVGFGVVPALVLLANMATDLLTADWSCSSVSWGNSGYSSGSVTLAPGEESITCTTIPGSYLVLLAIFGSIASLGAALRLLQGRGRNALGPIHLGAVVAGTMVAILAPFALDGVLTSSYLLLGGSYAQFGEPTGIRATVTTTFWLLSTSLAYPAAGYVAGRISGSSGGSNGIVSVVLGMLVPLALPTGPFFLLLEGYFLEGLAAVGLAVAGGYLGGRFGERFGHGRAQPDR
jgi:hypothetical protein